MEPITDGDGHPQNDIASFAANLAPFPESTNVVYDNLSAVIPPPEIHHLQVSPVRKLRPVRYGNGRSYVDMVDCICDMDEALMTCSSDLGFFSQFSTQNASAANDVFPRECGFVDSLAENGVACVGSRCLEAEISAVQQMKSEFDADCLNLLSQARILEAEFSSSSDDSEEHLNRKRKRETRKSLKLYLEDMVRKLMEKQEEMHKQLIDMIEKKEQERIIREEAWKQQEVERAKQDGELRAEETSRNLALISFLENLLGEEFQIPKSSEITSLVKDVHGQEGDIRCDPYNNRRWPKSEVQALVSVRTSLDHKFLKGAKGSVWEEVADGLAKMGFIRTPKKCKEKWENINKYYKRTIDSGKTRPKNYRSCPYFHELDLLYKKGLLNQGAGNCVKCETESKNAEE